MKLVTSSLVFYYFLYCEAMTYESANNSNIPSPKHCGHQYFTGFSETYDGAQVGEYPWLAVLPEADNRCAGAIITKRYVLVSNECLNLKLYEVHLGVHNTSKNASCDGEGLCSSVQILEINERVVSENSNLVLLIVNRDIEFSKTVGPICLPFDDFKKPEIDQSMFTSGWGLKSPEGHNSEIKKKVTNKLISNEECQKSGTIKNADDNSTMCVQLRKDFEIPACKGDEGGPIMYLPKPDQYVIAGVLNDVHSPDNTSCGSEDKPVSGFRITEKDLQWIVSEIHE